MIDCSNIGRDLLCGEFECFAYGRTDSPHITDESGAPCECGPECRMHNREPERLPRIRPKAPRDVMDCVHRGEFVADVDCGHG